MNPTDIVETWPMSHTPELLRLRSRGTRRAAHVSRPMIEILPAQEAGVLRGEYRIAGCPCQNLAYSKDCGKHQAPPVFMEV